MFSSIKNTKIIGMAAAVSNTWQSLYDVSGEDPELIQKFIKKTNVEGRYAAGLKQTTSDFCYAAANRLLEEKGVARSDVGVLVFVTQTADYGIPSTACLLQSRLGLSKDCIAFDVNLGCSGFTYGINIVASLLDRSETRYALLLCGDTSAKEKSAKKVTKTTHAASMLFGDSGTATLLAKDENVSPLVVSSRTDGEGYKAIISPYGQWRNPDRPENEAPGTRMDDIAVFNFATEEATQQINEYMEKNGTSSDDYDGLVLHQANMMIMKQIAKKTGFSPEKNLISLNKFGNTSSSSIPITIVYKYGDQDEEKELKFLCCGFGVGLSWATVALSINQKAILPLIQTDEYFDDGYPNG